MILPTIDRSVFARMSFRFPWRSYQERVLAEMTTHFSDERLHLVAPPGAGKTVLGLEIMRRIGKPTLVLAPNLTIREQWAQRLRADFLQEGELPEAWLSHDLRRPAAITITTYQALYHLAKNEPSSIGQLSCIEVMVADECHHLRREWWRILQQFRNRHDPILVALTATPPYDVQSLEWRRYHNFCGEIDEEISIPELVAEGNLCPHQDFVWSVLPTDEEQQEWDGFQSQRKDLIEYIQSDRSLGLYLLAHPWFTQTEEHWDDLFSRPGYFSSMLVVLRFLGIEPPASALGLLHAEETDLPKMSMDWLSIFLQEALHKDPYFLESRAKEIMQPIRQRLRRMGALEQKRVNLEEPEKLGRKLTSSQAKLGGILDILQLESGAMGEDLRMVILTDYIRKEALATSEYDQAPLNQLGAVPIFELIRRQEAILPAPVVLTGSLVIMPSNLVEDLTDLAYSELAATKILNIKQLDFDPDYSIISSGGIAAKRLVRWITTLFGQGKIKLIIGTKSLLGEGWDAPEINTLILANTVGSYVLSNQMRGRAIRTHASVPDKTANIWHLVTINPYAEDGGGDLEHLQRRFRAFAGPSVAGPPEIRNSLDRFPGQLAELAKEEVAGYNENMRLYARARAGLRLRWQEALTKGDHLVDAIQPPIVYRERKDGLSKYYQYHLNKSLPDFLREGRSEMLKGLIGGAILSVLVYQLPLFFQACIFFIISFAFLAEPKIWEYPIQRFRIIHYFGLGRTYFWQNSWLYLLIIGLLFLSFKMHILMGLCFVSFYLLVRYIIEDWSNYSIVKTWVSYQNLADTHRFIKRSAKAVLRSLLKNQSIYGLAEDAIQTEERPDGPVCYLANANHYQSQVFTEAMDELFSPVDNPRYMLGVKTSKHTDEAHYFPVPQSLARRKEDAESLQLEFAKQFEHVELVYTRTPHGRHKLLQARSLHLDNANDLKVQKERIWR